MHKNLNELTSSSTNGPVYKLGLALSGGGARGFAHLGAIKALEEFGLKPDIIAGVSAGSVAAVMYSAGIPVEKILEMFSLRKFSDFANVALRFKGNNGLFSLDPFKEFIAKSLSPYVNLEDLPIKTYLGVTDFDRGVASEFHEGNISERVVASCSIPLCFKPIEIDGVTYVDGGVVHNMPSWIIRDKCERLIGVNCSPVLPAKVQNSMMEVALRTYNLMAKANQAEDLAMCDLAIETPELAHYKVFNLKEIKKVYISGYASMRRALKRSKWVSDYLSQGK